MNRDVHEPEEGARLVLEAAVGWIAEADGWDEPRARHRYKVEINAEAPSGGDAAASKLDFYSRSAPKGLDELMRRHPNITIMAVHLDMSAPTIYREVTKANQLYHFHKGVLNYDFNEADYEANQAMLEHVFREVCAGQRRPLPEHRDDEAGERASSGS